MAARWGGGGGPQRLRRRRKIWIVCCGCLGALCQNIDHFWRSAHSFLLFFIFLLYLTHGVFLTTSFYWFQIIFVIFPFLASILFLKCISISGRFGKKPYLLLYNVLERYSKLIGKLERFETIFVFFPAQGAYLLYFAVTVLARRSFIWWPDLLRTAL